MENLILKREKNAKNVFASPEVNFRANIGVCDFAGESCLENTIEFYEPILKWLEQYKEEGKQSLEFNFKITYFNTSSSRSILDIITVLKDMIDDGKNVTINWFYDPDNRIAMRQEVDDFEDDAGVKMNFLPLIKED